MLQSIKELNENFYMDIDFRALHGASTDKMTYFHKNHPATEVYVPLSFLQTKLITPSHVCFKINLRFNVNSGYPLSLVEDKFCMKFGL